jgi:hypothetical protein
VRSASSGEIFPGLWRFTATHPEWTEEEGGEEGWDPVVAWWATRTSRGLLLIDPLVTDWGALDAIVSEQGGCAAVVRTIRWRERDVAPAADRYGASVWAAASAVGGAGGRVDHPLADGDELWDGIQAFDVERADEIALWLAPTRRSCSATRCFAARRASCACVRIRGASRPPAPLGCAPCSAP